MKFNAHKKTLNFLHFFLKIVSCKNWTSGMEYMSGKNDNLPCGTNCIRSVKFDNILRVRMVFLCTRNNIMWCMVAMMMNGIWNKLSSIICNIIILIMQYWLSWQHIKIIMHVSYSTAEYLHEHLHITPLQCMETAWITTDPSVCRLGDSMVFWICRNIR